jgi:hypothetical protein
MIYDQYRLWIFYQHKWHLGTHNFCPDESTHRSMMLAEGVKEDILMFFAPGEHECEVLSGPIVCYGCMRQEKHLSRETLGGLVMLALFSVDVDDAQPTTQG